MLGLSPSELPAIVDGTTGEAVTFRELLEDARRITAAMGDHRSLLAVACRNDRHSVTAYAAALTAGHPVLLLDGMRPASSLVDLILDYGVRWLAAPAGSTNALAEAGVRVQDAIPVRDGELLRFPGPQPRLHPDLALLLSTSGTTGSRKLVRLSATNVESNATAIATMLRLTPAERPITSLPLHYTFGHSVLNSHWRAGAAVALTKSSVLQPSFWETFRNLDCTSLAGVPYTFQMLERVGFRSMTLPTLTSLQQAGGGLSPELTSLYAHHLDIVGGRLHVMYGQTEATARMAWLPPHRLEEKLGSAGQVIPGGHLTIEDGVADPVTGRLVGEVVYSGPNVMLGYATTAADLAVGDVTGGILRTGDIGWLDDEAFLFIVGRSKRIAKVFGLRVNLDEVEAALRETGPAAVVANGDTIVAYCAFESDEQVAEATTRLAQRFRIHRSALRFHRVDAIPIMGSGKVDYQELQRRAGG
jgi:acyl-CoA synthetase (AMP-forming)/AMP-acid ligase II